MNQIKEIKEKSKSYLSFMIGEELFAAHVGHVNNIIEVPRITEIPDTPDFIKGAIDLRGTVLPVVDVRLKFGMAPIKITPLTCVLVLEINLGGNIISVGALVDNVHEVLEINKGQIQSSPHIRGMQSANKFIEGMVKINEQFLMILNVNKIFDSEHLHKIQDQIISTQKT